MKKWKCPRCGKEFEKEEIHLMCATCGFQLSTYRLEKALAKKKFLKAIKPFVILGVIAIVFLSGILFFLSQIHIGQECADGGVIFFDKLHYSDGWRYLAVSPKDIEKTVWSDKENEKISGELVFVIGKGDYNSYNIIHRYGAKSAAYKAITYGKTEDWYLGNKREMQILGFVSYTKFFRKKLQKFEEFDSLISTEDEQKYYWTSEVEGSKKAYAVTIDSWKPKTQLFSLYAEKDEDGNDIEASVCYVRPIRKF